MAKEFYKDNAKWFFSSVVNRTRLGAKSKWAHSHLKAPNPPLGKLGGHNKGISECESAHARCGWPVWKFSCALSDCSCVDHRIPDQAERKWIDFTCWGACLEFTVRVSPRSAGRWIIAGNPCFKRKLKVQCLKLTESAELPIGSWNSRNNRNV